jgi:hypothetical protein
MTTKFDIREVIYITSEGPITLKPADPELDTAILIAGEVGAVLFVRAAHRKATPDGWLWEVYRVTRPIVTWAKRDQPEPVKTFIAPTPDGAVMWAIMQGEH